MRHCGFLRLDHRRDIVEQLVSVVDDAVLDHIFDPPDVVDLPVRLQTVEAGAIERLQILQRIFRRDDEIGELARFDKPIGGSMPRGL